MDYKFSNLAAAIIFSIAIIFGWQFFYEKPRAKELALHTNKYKQQVLEVKKAGKNEQKLSTAAVTGNISEGNGKERIIIKSPDLAGSIALRGLRFDNLTLLKYQQDTSRDSPPVSLFVPGGSDKTYFAEIGWQSKDKKLILPDSTTLWHTDSPELTDGNTVNLTWLNPDGIRFQVSISLDENYLFTIEQAIFNTLHEPVTVQCYGLINRSYSEPAERVVNILHQGMIGAINDELKEVSYDDIKKHKREIFSKAKVQWLGITDKYWLAAFIPDQKEEYNANYIYAIKGGNDKYQADFISAEKLIEAGGKFSLVHQLFAGAKKVDLLDKYESKYNIKLFDRAIDFGWFYILTKPIFNALNFFYRYVGNFGISIMIVTVLIKLVMFTLANKSYRSMKKMKKLQPEMERLKQLYNEDKVRLNQEVMALYKRYKVNPVAGCLPLIVQIPVFFSIYKVLYVTIEMRHAPFFGWIHDLSAPDPTNIFNLFGLLPFSPPAFLHIGAWPIIMALTMFFQQKMSPAPADPIQAQIMKFMPLFFLFMFGNFPAGLLIYWSWNNILSIIQQAYINKLDHNES